MRLRIIHPPKRMQGDTKIAMEICDRVMAGDCLTDEIYRALMLPALVRHNAEKMQTVGVIGVDRKDLPIYPLGLLQSPGLMEFPAAFQRLPSVEHATPSPPTFASGCGYGVPENNGKKKAQSPMQFLVWRGFVWRSALRQTSVGALVLTVFLGSG